MAGPKGNPKDNAAPFYEKAFELAVLEPNELTRDELKAWPDDLSKEKQQALTKWWADNTRALTELKQGASRPYWSRQYVGNHVWEVLAPNLAEMRMLTYAICARAKLKAARGDLAGAFDDILTAKRFGTHIAQRSTLVEQLAGIAVRALAAHTAVDILTRAKTTDTSLKELEKVLADAANQSVPPIDLRCEELMACEAIDIMLSDDASPPSEAEKNILRQLLTGSDDSAQQFLDTLEKWDKNDRQNLKGEVRNYYAFLQAQAKKTPWETNEKKAELAQQMQQKMNSNPVLGIMAPALFRVAELGWRLKIDEDALRTIVAVLRYKQEKGGLPENLDELVKAGYLKQVPRDPFAPGAVTYKRKDDDFLLYSWAGDFDDDGGTSSDWGRDGGDQVFWPVQKR